MTIKKLKVPVNSLEDLAAHPEYEAGPYGKGGTALDIFKVSVHSGGSRIFRRGHQVNVRFEKIERIRTLGGTHTGSALGSANGISDCVLPPTS